MSTIDGVIAKLNEQDAVLSADVTEHWNKMMFAASARGIIRARVPVLKLLKVLTESSKTKKHRKKLRGYFNAIAVIAEEDLNSKTYIKKVLTPLKAIREDFKEWVKSGSLKNVIDEADIKYILAKAKIVAEAEADAVVEQFEQVVAKAA